MSEIFLQQPVSAMDDVTRALPHAIGPEKSVISSMLVNPEFHIPAALELDITADHFYLPAHRTLVETLFELFEDGTPIELVSLVQILLDKGLLDRCGGAATVCGLWSYSPSDSHFSHHVQLVRDKHVLRSLIQNGQETIAAAYDAPDEVDELLDRCESQMMLIRDSRNTRAAAPTTRATVEEVLTDIHSRMRGETVGMGISTGYQGFDNLGARLKPGEMFVIAARPSMGKTALMMNIIESIVVDRGQAGMVFSLEMRTFQLIQRMIFGRAKANRKDFIPGYASNNGELNQIKRASMDIAKAKLFIDDTPALTIGSLRAKARRRHREITLSIIAVDYLQLMRSTSKQAAGSREREIAEISSGLKSLAKELGVPVVVLAQLNRGPEARTGKDKGKPRMSDLRESGSIEQDADMVGLLYRAAYYADTEEEKDALAGVAELVLAKNRDGETGHIPLTFIAEFTRFEDGRPAQEEMKFSSEPKSRYND